VLVLTGSLLPPHLRVKTTNEKQMQSIGDDKSCALICTKVGGGWVRTG
jgi:hypothetical protein